MSEEKVVGFSSASIFPAKKREAFTQGGTMKPGDRPPDAEETQGAGIVKGWEDKLDLGRIPDTFT